TDDAAPGAAISVVADIVGTAGLTRAALAGRGAVTRIAAVALPGRGIASHAGRAIGARGAVFAAGAAPISIDGTATQGHQARTKNQHREDSLHDVSVRAAGAQLRT